ncbi:MFS transporter [Sciscionella sediminilitoris]|uniref:MFS transporter n=1 Tax=Sciscionella sediminilitoris TaxID=1445613 RepID=UPI0004DFA32F|nr:MFS transporter [Sciscionella sp. SE31]
MKLRARFAVLGEGFDRKLLAPMISGAILNPVNSSIISVSLVPIGAAFGAPPTATAWLVSALYLATAVGQPVAGKLIDVHGPRRLFLGASVLVGLAGLLGMLAPGLGVLIVARVLLGFGTCAGYPAAMRMIRDEAERTGKDSPAGVLTVLAMATQTIAVIGPPLGGLLIGIGGWRATLGVNIPFAILAFVLGARRIPATARKTTNRPNLDFPGMALFAGMLVSLLLFLMHPSARDWYLPLITVVAAIAFVLRELRATEPFIDVRMLAGNRPLVTTYLRALLAYIVSYAFLYGYTQWLEDGRGLTAAQAGLIQLPVFATALVVSGLTGRRKEVRAKLAVGALCQILACALMLVLWSESGIWLLVGIALIFGITQGLMSLALQNSVYHQANPDSIGTSAGLLRTFSYLGAIVASAAQGGFYGQRADTGGLHQLATFLLVMGGLLLLITLADRKLGRTIH